MPPSSGQHCCATVTMPAADMFWGDRFGVLTDPYGHKSSFATHLKDLTPAENAGGNEGSIRSTQVNACPRDSATPVPWASSIA